MSCSKAAIINITVGLVSISDNSSAGSFVYRTSKVKENMTHSDKPIDSILIEFILFRAPSHVISTSWGQICFLLVNQNDFNNQLFQ